MEKEIDSSQNVILFIGAGLIVGLLTAALFGIVDKIGSVRKKKNGPNRG